MMNSSLPSIDCTAHVESRGIDMGLRVDCLGDLPKSRTLLAVANPILMLVVCSSFLGIVDSYPYSDENSVALQGTRLKRMNQIACHCCSNSFNSHCCLQCMQRVGKKSSLPETSELDVHEPWQNDYFRSFAFEPKSFALETKFNPCTCCYYQLQRNPYLESSPCCDECRQRKKRSADSPTEEDDENAAMA